MYQRCIKKAIISCPAEQDNPPGAWVYGIGRPAEVCRYRRWHRAYSAADRAGFIIGPLAKTVGGIVAAVKIPAAAL